MDFKPLNIRKFPWGFWLIGLIIIVLSILVLYNILLPKNSESRFFKGIDGR